VVALTYAAAGILWIALSEWATHSLLGDVDQATVQLTKGIGFVVVTSFALLAVLGRSMRALEESTEAQQALASEVRERAAAQRRLVHRLMNAEEETRRAVAKELHDGPLQALTLSFMRLDAASRKVDGREATIDAEQVETAMGAIQKAAEEIRQILRALHPPLLADLGLCAAVERHCREVAGLTGRDVRLTVDGDTRMSLDNRTSITAFRIVQEAVANAAKHTRKGKVRVRIRIDPDAIALDIEDEGPGFTPEQAPALGLGLVSMRERAESVGGHLEVRSAERGGTHVCASIPITASS
jgi:two-component system, NarL family, sensor histidine kinase DegS